MPGFWMVSPPTSDHKKIENQGPTIWWGPLKICFLVIVNTAHYGTKAISCMNKVAIILLQWIIPVQCVTINVSAPAPYDDDKKKTPNGEKQQQSLLSNCLPSLERAWIICPMYRRHRVAMLIVSMTQCVSWGRGRHWGEISVVIRCYWHLSNVTQVHHSNPHCPHSPSCLYNFE